MKYIAPDYEMVSLNVSDICASYPITGCPHEHSSGATVPCTSSDPNYWEMDFIQEGWGIGCYATQNP